MKGGLKERIVLAAGPLAAAWLIRLLHRSMKVEIIGDQELQSLWGHHQRAILCAWHDQILLMGQGYPGKDIKTLISASKDGELIARTIAQFGYSAVRGSSTRGGKAAFKAMLNLAKEPVDLAITPDGPKGPRHQIKEGIVHLARLTGRPVIPVAFVCSKGHRFASWDRFLLPFPFARGVYSFGSPLYFSESESPEAFSLRLQAAMEENEMRARRRLEEHGVSAV